MCSFHPGSRGKNGPAKAVTLAVRVNLIDVLEVARRPTNALTSQVVEANVGEEELVLVAGIHRWREVAVFKEKTFFLA